MANAPARLKQSDLTRYVKALRDAGASDWEIRAEPDGPHVISAGKVNEAIANSDDIDAMIAKAK